MLISIGTYEYCTETSIQLETTLTKNLSEQEKEQTILILSKILRA